MYADDTTLYTHLPSLDSVQSACSKLQAGVDALAQWGHQWRVSFEPSKSQAMTITRHRKPWHIPSVPFQGTEVAEYSHMKLLGVTFDDRLSYGEHIRTVATRFAQRIGFLRKACPFLDPPGRLATYRGFVRPTMEYCPPSVDGRSRYPASSTRSCPTPRAETDQQWHRYRQPRRPPLCSRPHTPLQAPLQAKSSSSAISSPKPGP